MLSWHLPISAVEPCLRSSHNLELKPFHLWLQPRKLQFLFQCVNSGEKTTSFAPLNPSSTLLKYQLRQVCPSLSLTPWVCLISHIILCFQPVDAGPTACRYDSCDASVNNSKASIGYAVPSNTTDVQSPASTAKLTFQSFANLIPSAFSWSPRPTQWIDTSWPSQDAEPLGRLSFGNGNRKGIPENKEKSYVSKERQLEKLRSRLEEEQRVRRCASGAPSLCGKCDDKLVNL